MGTLAEKLSYLDGTKTAIKNAIIAKGVDVEDADTFRAYADKIGQIEGGGIPEYMMYAIVDDGATSVPTMPDAKYWLMSKVYIPSSVTQIGDNFVTRSAITEASGGGSGLTFGVNAFQYCSSLVTIDLPTATVFGGNVFSGCTSLANIGLGNRSNVLTLINRLYLQSDNLTVNSFLQVGNALVDNTGGGVKTIHVKSVAWNNLTEEQKAIFTNKNYTVNVS